ncbi:MAG: C1 family peptidase, partial [Anaerolineae bacterium]
RPAPESPELSNSDAPLGLDSAFNWCDLGGCTPVKDQGYCGSCWAFSTVGPLESNILLQDGETKDLSEQYLVSCNMDGWDCGGGWFAHDYHEDTKLPAEPEAGAVYEDDFPYVAPPVPSCSSPYPHHEKIISWAYVGNWWSVPSDASIKQAIYDYGPVSAAVCAGLSWGGYDSESGVFDTDETQWCIVNFGQSVNHAIVLVGWDDNQGTNGVWILRNSWGPGWGEDGYMLIEYGISNVGYAANYIVYSPACHDLSTSANPGEGGSVVTEPSPNCGGDGYEPGTEVQLTASANSGWHFTGWGGDASGASSPITDTMDSDKSIAAHFMCDGCTPSGYVPLGMKE